MPVFNFHGIRAAIECPSDTLLEEFKRDFAYFASRDEGETSHVRLELRIAAPPPDKAAFRSLLRWRSARIAHTGKQRRVDYGGKALLEYDLAKECGVLYGEDHALLHELGYLTILSRVGELLDRRGLHRIHALGFSYLGKAGLLLLPSNGGKSRIGLELLGREGFSFLADDTPLVDGAKAHAFPLSLSLRGDDWRGIPPRHIRRFPRRRFGVKHLVDIGYYGGKVGPQAPLSWILLGDRNGRERPRFRPVSAPRAAAALLSPLILGVGSPQVLELMLPPPPYIGGALRLASIAVKRAACAARLASRARSARFHLCDDPRANADALQDFLDRNAPQ